MSQMLIFWIMIIVSTIVSVAYLVLGLVFHVTFDNGKQNKKNSPGQSASVSAQEDADKGASDKDNHKDNNIDNDDYKSGYSQENKNEGGRSVQQTDAGPAADSSLKRNHAGKKEEDNAENNAEKNSASQEYPEDKAAKQDSKEVTVQEIVDDSEEEEEEPVNEERLACIMRFTVMFLCPVIGPLFFLFGHLLYRTVFRKEVDLADVVFSKERVRTNVRADEERERDIVPVEEALAVSDKSSLRSLMLNVIRGDVQSSLAAISLALNSHDSETAHYAASVLQDELNDFRFNVQKVFQEIEFEPEDETEFEEALIPYMNNVLVQRVFTEMEQKKFVYLMSDAGDYLYRKNASRITSQFYEWISLRLLDIAAFDKMEIWCNRAAAQYPEELASFTCKLKLYFTSQQREKFFQVMNELKESEVVIDSETLELIRTFS